ncbi:hypothetical protein MTO96_007145 [Rhipicephalus appendiculatus]
MESTLRLWPTLLHLDVVAIGFAATQKLLVRFKGKSAHAGATPWEGLNALDAAVAAYVNVSVLRQQLKPTARIHGTCIASLTRFARKGKLRH